LILIFFFNSTVYSEEHKENPKESHTSPALFLPYQNYICEHAYLDGYSESLKERLYAIHDVEELKECVFCKKFLTNFKNACTNQFGKSRKKLEKAKALQQKREEDRKKSEESSPEGDAQNGETSLEIENKPHTKVKKRNIVVHIPKQVDPCAPLIDAISAMSIKLSQINGSKDEINLLVRELTANFESSKENGTMRGAIDQHYFIVVAAYLKQPFQTLFVNEKARKRKIPKEQIDKDIKEIFDF
jgi:hypothetical protein